MFLSLAIIYGDISELHERYLAAFYEEEFDAKTGYVFHSEASNDSQKKGFDTIWTARYRTTNWEAVQRRARTVSKMYSGYLHGASDQIMDIYFGDPPVFHTNGILGTSRHREYRDD